MALLVLPLLPDAAAASVPYRMEAIGGCAAYTVLAVLFLLRDPRRRAFYDRLSGTEIVLVPRDGT
jgi:hypothetical protein